MSKNTKKALLNDGDVMVAVPIFYTVYGAKTKAEQNLRQFHRIEAFTCVYCVIIVVRGKRSNMLQVSDQMSHSPHN